MNVHAFVTVRLTVDIVIIYNPCMTVTHLKKNFTNGQRFLMDGFEEKCFCCGKMFGSVRFQLSLS